MDFNNSKQSPDEPNKVIQPEIIEPEVIEPEVIQPEELESYRSLQREIELKKASKFRPPSEIEPERIASIGLGFRYWSLDDGLCSTAFYYKWAPGVNIASCKNNRELRPHTPHKAPSENCNCGFNCFSGLPDDKIIRRFSRDGIWGGIVFSGNTQVHEDGFRAEEAQVIALYSPEEKVGTFSESVISKKKRRAKNKYRKTKIDMYQETADKYSVPLFTDRNEFSEYCASFNKSDPKEILSGTKVSKANQASQEILWLHQTPVSSKKRRPMRASLIHFMIQMFFFYSFIALVFLFVTR